MSVVVMQGHQHVRQQQSFCYCLLSNAQQRTLAAAARVARLRNTNWNRISFPLPEFTNVCYRIANNAIKSGIGILQTG
jgi:hypothetical protein